MFSEKSDKELVVELKSLHGAEVETQIAILWRLREVELRKLDLASGRSSMYEFAREELAYSKMRRIRRSLPPSSSIFIRKWSRTSAAIICVSRHSNKRRSRSILKTSAEKPNGSRS